ncbi:hypothetical protein RUND412_007586 [Rhizina undulata]
MGRELTLTKALPPVVVNNAARKVAVTTINTEGQFKMPAQQVEGQKAVPPAKQHITGNNQHFRNNGYVSQQAGRQHFANGINGRAQLTTSNNREALRQVQRRVSAQPAPQFVPESAKHFRNNGFDPSKIGQERLSVVANNAAGKGQVIGPNRASLQQAQGGQIRMLIQQAQHQYPGDAINVRNNGPQLRQQRPLGTNWASGIARTATPNNGGQIRAPIQQAPVDSNNFGNNGSLAPELGQQRLPVTAPNTAKVDLPAQYRRAPVQVQRQIQIQSTTQPDLESTNRPQANGYTPPSLAPDDSASYSFWDELDKLDAAIPSFD